MSVLYQKQYFCKVYDHAGNFLTVLQKVKLGGFRKQIGGGLGQATLTIPRKFDDFDEDYIIAHRNKIDVWCVDIDTGSTGVKIYSGYIPDYNPKADKGSESVDVLLYGFRTELEQTILLSGTTLNFRTDTTSVLVLDDLGTLQAVDPVKVVKKIIDFYQAIKTGYALTYDSVSIPALAGNTMAYGFSVPTSSDAIDTAMGFMPAGWWNYVGADNKFQLKAKPVTPSFTFVQGRDFEMIDTDKSIQKIVNCVLFTNGGTSPALGKIYKDSASIAKYGEYWDRLDDSKVKDITTANAKSLNYLNTNCVPTIRTKFRVFDNNLALGKGADIESIDPGMTVKFRGFNAITSKTFNDNMQVVAVDYTPDYADVELEGIQPDIARDVIDLIKDTEYAQPNAASSTTDTTYTQ